MPGPYALLICFSFYLVVGQRSLAFRVARTGLMSPGACPRQFMRT